MKGISLLLGVLLGSMHVYSQTTAGNQPVHSSLAPAVMVSNTHFIKPVGAVRKVHNLKKKPAHVQKTGLVLNQK